MRRRARKVSRSGSPGPAPTRDTSPPPKREARVVERFLQGRAGLVIAAAQHQLGDRALQHALPEAPPLRRLEARLDSIAERPRQRGESSVAGRDEAFQARAQQARQHGRGAAARYRHDERRAFDDRGQDERAQRRLVDHVHRDVPRSGGGGDRLVYRDVVGGGDHHRDTRSDSRPENVAARCAIRAAARSASKAAQSAGASTVTRAPARTSNAALRAATSPPPTTRQGCSRTSRRIGRKSMAYYARDRAQALRYDRFKSEGACPGFLHCRVRRAWSASGEARSRARSGAASWPRSRAWYRRKICCAPIRRSRWRTMPALERMEAIKDAAFTRRMRERLLPSSEVLVARLAEMSRDAGAGRGAARALPGDRGAAAGEASRSGRSGRLAAGKGGGTARLAEAPPGARSRSAKIRSHCWHTRIF